MARTQDGSVEDGDHNILQSEDPSETDNGTEEAKA
jgi:hypothetical protein